MSGALLSIPLAEIAEFPTEVRRYLLAYAGMTHMAAEVEPADAQVSKGRPSTSEDGPAELTVAMVRRLLAEPINEKTIAVLQAIAESDSPEIHQRDLVAKVQGANSYLDLKGAWSGITRRTRRIVDDEEALFIWWDNQGVFDDGEYVDHIGCIASLTHRSLRTYFKIDQN